jgi:NADPH:quinone reductase-like Zn-dependent oxidoreductase
MKAFILDKFGAGFDGLAETERDVPEPGPYEVLVRVHARSVNYRDLRILAGLYPVSGQRGTVALSDGAGEVVAIGNAVKSIALGQKVTTVYFPRWQDGAFSVDRGLEQYGCTRDGTLAEYLLADEHGVIPFPDHLSYREAATLPCAAVTAWAALHGPRPILPGETVMTIGSGGVALFVVQFAKLFGARVLVVSHSPEKRGRLADLGADDVVFLGADRRWVDEIRSITGGRGVDHLVETGSNDTVEGSVACAAENAAVTIVAALDPGKIEARAFFMAPILIRRTYVGSRAHFAAMNRAIALHRLRPVLDSAFNFSQAGEAFRRFGQRNQFGKIVIPDNAD